MPLRSHCSRPNIGGLGALFALFDIELDGLADREVLVLAIAGTVVKEHIVLSLNRDKPETLFGLRLDNSCSHVW